MFTLGQPIYLCSRTEPTTSSVKCNYSVLAFTIHVTHSPPCCLLLAGHHGIFLLRHITSMCLMLYRTSRLGNNLTKQDQEPMHTSPLDEAWKWRSANEQLVQDALMILYVSPHDHFV